MARRKSDLLAWSFIVGERFAGNVRWPPNLVGACFADFDGFWVNRRRQWLHVETSLSIRTLLRQRPDAMLKVAFRARMILTVQRRGMIFLPLAFLSFLTRMRSANG